MKRIEESKRLRQELAELDKKLSEAMSNKKSLAADLASMESDIQHQYALAVDEVAVSDTVLAGGDYAALKHRVLTTKAFNENAALKQQTEKLRSGLDAQTKYVATLQASRRKTADELAVVENMAAVEALHVSTKHFLDAFVDCEAAYSDMKQRLLSAPANAGGIAERLGIRDAFYQQVVNHKPAEGESLIDFLTWACSLLVDNNPLYAPERAARPKSEFRRSHAFAGVAFPN